MQINCTVIIQAINFLITYIFLREFFLRPAVHLVRQKDMAKKILSDKLQAKELMVNNLINKRNMDLDAFRTKIKKLYIIPSKPEMQLNPNVLAAQQIKVSDEMVENCKNVVIKGANDVL